MIQKAEVEQLRSWYASGLSTRQITERSGYSKSYVYKLCRDIARDQSAAAQLRQPPGNTTHWRSCRNQARKVVERALGRKLQREEHVHHKDHNHANNKIENLEIMDIYAHALLHHPKNPIPRHLRPERQAYMKTYLKSYRRAHAA